MTTAATGTNTVRLDRWNETIRHGDGSGSGEEYGDWVEAGRSSSYGGDWRYPRARLGARGWEWAGESGRTDTDLLAAETHGWDGRNGRNYTARAPSSSATTRSGRGLQAASACS